MRFFNSKITLAVLVLLVLWVGQALAKELYRRHQVQQEINAVQEDVYALEREKKKIEEDIASFQKDSTIEREARTRLNLKKQGEKVVIIIPPAAQSKGAGDSTAGVFQDPEQSQGNPSFLHRALSWFNDLIK